MRKRWATPASSPRPAGTTGRRSPPAAKHGLKAIVVQECYDSRGVGQPEIIEKARACEAYGAEVVQLSVGPELFYKFLLLLEETGYFNASLYTPYSILGIETLGYEIVEDALRLTGRLPDMIICTNAGGGNLTGTARGVMRATKEKIEIVGASVNLAGLHMASDHDFNRKSFTTGHTGFGVPFMTNPDRSDVPVPRPGRSAISTATSPSARARSSTLPRRSSPSRESSAARPGTPRSPRPSAWREASRGQDHRRPGDGIHRRRQAPPSPAFLREKPGHRRSFRRPADGSSRSRYRPPGRALDDRGLRSGFGLHAKAKD